MTPYEIELCGALASVLDGPEEHVLGPTDARIVVRALRIAAAVSPGEVFERVAFLEHTFVPGRGEILMIAKAARMLADAIEREVASVVQAR